MDNHVTEEQMQQMSSAVATDLMLVTQPIFRNSYVNVVRMALMQFTASMLITLAKVAGKPDEVEIQFGIDYLQHCLDDGFHVERIEHSSSAKMH